MNSRYDFPQRRIPVITFIIPLPFRAIIRLRCMSRFISMTRFFCALIHFCRVQRYKHLFRTRWYDSIFLCIDTLLSSDEDIFLAQPLSYPLLPITPFACASSVIISIYIAVERCLHVYGNNVLVLSDLRNGSRGISASNYAWTFASLTLISE